MSTYIAETERREIKERQKQGIEIAKQNGNHKGKQIKFHLDDADVKEALHQYYHRNKNGLSVTQIARLHGMGRPEIYKLKNRYETVTNF